MNTNEKIRKYRKERGLTQKKLGELSGIAETTIRRYELGDLNPKIETIKKIAKALNVSHLDLLSNEELQKIADDVMSETRAYLATENQRSNMQRRTLENIRTWFGEGAYNAFNNLTITGDLLVADALEVLIKDILGEDEYLKLSAKEKKELANSIKNAMLLKKMEIDDRNK